MRYVRRTLQNAIDEYFSHRAEDDSIAAHDLLSILDREWAEHTLAPSM